MSKPYIIVHMMESVDGRIDCGMTAQLSGTSEYYSTLDAINASTRISGRVTAATELTDGGKYTPQSNVALVKQTLPKIRPLIVTTLLLIRKER